MLNYTLVGLLGIILGAYLSYRVNQITNKQLLDALKAELEQYMVKAQTGRLTPEEQARINGLQEALRILQKK